MLIRRETARDEPAVRSITVAAFARPDAGEPIEAGLLDRLRRDPGWLPALSLVADEDGAVVGHVVCTRGRVGDVPVLGLGPISVRPDRQRAGVGTALMHAVLGAAEGLGEPLVGLLGAPELYSRFGFRPAADFGIVPPDPAWGRYFQARPLTAWAGGAGGPFRYAAPFDEL